MWRLESRVTDQWADDRGEKNVGKPFFLNLERLDRGGRCHVCGSISCAFFRCCLFLSLPLPCFLCPIFVKSVPVDRIRQVTPSACRVMHEAVARRVAFPSAVCFFALRLGSDGSKLDRLGDCAAILLSLGDKGVAPSAFPMLPFECPPIHPLS